MKLNEERQRKAGEHEKQRNTEGKKKVLQGAKSAKGKAASIGGARGMEPPSAVELDGDVHPSRRSRLHPT